GSNLVNAILPVDLLALDDSGWITVRPRPSLAGTVSLGADLVSRACDIAAGNLDVAADNARDHKRVSKGREILNQHNRAARARAQAEMYRRLAGHAKKAGKVTSLVGYGMGLENDRAHCEEICGRGAGAAGSATD